MKRLKGGFSWNQVKIMRELQSLFSLSYHPNIVQLHEILREKDDSVYFVFEFMKQGSIHDLLVHRSKTKLGPVSDSDARNILEQTLSGLLHLHRHGYIHRDLKPENILCNGKVWKVADFSLARQVHQELPMTSYVSTRWYRAPEVLLCKKFYAYPVDCFAVGCIGAELYRLRPIFHGSNELDQLSSIFTFLGTPAQLGWIEGVQLASRLGILRHEETEVDEKNIQKSHFRSAEMLLNWLYPNRNNVDRTKIDFLMGLLMLNPKSRLSAEQALAHDFFVVDKLSPSDHLKHSATSSAQLNATFQDDVPEETMTTSFSTPGANLEETENGSKIVTVSPIPRHYQKSGKDIRCTAHSSEQTITSRTMLRLHRPPKHNPYTKKRDERN